MKQLFSRLFRRRADKIRAIILILIILIFALWRMYLAGWW
jgi:hypothetical protein